MRRSAGATLLLAGGILAAAAAAPKKTPRLLGEPAAQVRREFEAVCSDFRSGRNPFYGLAQIEDLKRRLVAEPPDPAERVALRGRLAQELLRVGQPEEAVRLLTEAGAIARDEKLPDEVRLHVLRDLGLAQLRRGEQKNCIGYHGPAACIFPISESGIHRDKEAALAAMRIFSEYVPERPDDLVRSEPGAWSQGHGAQLKRTASGPRRMVSSDGLTRRSMARGVICVCARYGRPGTQPGNAAACFTQVAICASSSSSPSWMSK